MILCFVCPQYALNHQKGISFMLFAQISLSVRFDEAAFVWYSCCVAFNGYRTANSFFSFFRRKGKKITNTRKKNMKIWLESNVMFWGETNDNGKRNALSHKQKKAKEPSKGKGKRRRTNKKRNSFVCRATKQSTTAWHWILRFSLSIAPMSRN